MNSEVIKNFKLEIRKNEPEDIGQTVFEDYIFECRNCQKQITETKNSKGSRMLDPIKIEFDLSLHLMECEYYKNR